MTDALWLLLFHFLPGSSCSVEIDATVQQRLASKIELLRNDSAAARRAAPGTMLRCSAARPVEMVSLIRVAPISSGDRGAYVPSGNQALGYLGLCQDLTRMTMTMMRRLSPSRRDTVLLALTCFHAGRSVTTLSIMHLLGLMAASHLVVPLGLVLIRRIQRGFAPQRLDPRRYKLRVLSVLRSMSPELEYWRSPPALLKGFPIGRLTSYLVVFMDATLPGCGGNVPLRLGRR